MNTIRKILPSLLPLALFAALAPGAQADVAELRSGELVEGRFLGGTQGSVRFEVAGKTRVLPLAEILALTFDARPQEPAQPAAPAAQPATSPAAARGAVAPAPAAPAVLSVPSGTSITVRLRDSIDSNRHGAGHRFTAVLEGNLSAGGQVVAPKGATVYGQITSAQKSRRLVGKSEMEITLTGISIGGDIVPISTGSARASTSNTAGRTIGKVGRGAAIGGLANGSKGARRGAKIGAGAALLTHGNSLHAPAGTLLDFTLAQPLTR